MTENALLQGRDVDGGPLLSSYRPVGARPSSISSPFKGVQQVELELRLLEALAIYHPSKLAGMHRHFVLFGLMDHLERRLNQQFSPNEVLQLLDCFFNVALLADDDDMELMTLEEEFSLPSSIFEDIKEAL
ncbi:hypothetical protein BDL97_11G098500 [Sphagnum fallax]|nr:hypothetical protein BDL97_11G098500 [Sphagnum fallax]KAH8948525.1 hypothetical protein BDL97_11G098500 [Sphagnum fallax]